MMIGTLGSVGSLVAATLYRWNDDRNPFSRFISSSNPYRWNDDSPWFSRFISSSNSIDRMMIGTLGSVGSLVAATLYRWNDDRNPWFSRFISSSNPLSME